jgi:(1->4)-alpha-D-glucan 1-alpha-D-glucosylmutase
MNRWLDGVFGDRELVVDIERFVASIAAAGDRNALAQLLVKLIAPGVPDFYQGAELRDGSLVDPDNRRVVDFDERRAALSRARDATIDDIAAANDLGLAKLWTIHRVLGLRRRRPDRFAGPYAPLQATGPHAQRVFAAKRGSSLVAVVPRLSIGSEGFRDTWLMIPEGQWRDVLSDRTLSGGSRPVAELWAKFPIALLVAEPLS